MALKVHPARIRQLSVMAAPIVIAMLTQTFINVVDTFFVGKLDPSVSIPGQAALGYSLPLLWAISGSLAAIGVGTQVMTARRFGAGEHTQAGVVLHNGLIIALISSLLMSLAAWFFVPHIFQFLSPNEAVVELGVPYARVRIVGALSFVATMAYKGFFDGIGKTRVHMIAAIVMNLANIILNYLLIFGAGPIPAYGVTGAAIASLISTFIGLAVMMGWSVAPAYREYGIYRLSNANRRTLWELIKLSVPSGLAQVFIMSGVLMFLKIIGHLDADAITAALQSVDYYQAPFEVARAGNDALREAQGLAQPLLVSDWGATLMASRPPLYSTAAKLIIDLLSLTFVTCIAFGTATATLVSQSMGRRDFEAAAGYGWDSVKAAMYVFGALGVVIMIAPGPFLSLLSDDALVIQAATPGMRLMGGGLMFTAMALVLTQALFGAGATKFVMLVELLLHGLCLAPLTYLLAIALDMGFMGVWLSASCYIGLLATLMAWKFWGGSWESIEV